jgi:uncharacterized membrane-anchored protein
MSDLARTDELFYTRAGLDRAKLERQVDEALAGADDGEMFLEYRQSESLAYDDGRLKSASFDTSQGFGLRSDSGEAAGYAHATDLSHDAIGRAAQRLLEIETYRLMALLAFPVAREAGPRIEHVDRELSAITTAMGDFRGTDVKPEGERRLLERLMGLAAEIERVTAGADYRFGAARAYHALVERRIAELREQRAVPGIPTIGEFMDRRLAPAMRSCLATADRLRALAARLARAGTLLRTRVDIALEAQNQTLLASMDRRARLQLRLQQTVEGLSVAAISYYVVGLLGYAARAGEAAGLPIPHDLAVGLAIPLVLLGVWLLVHRVRRHLGADSAAREP